MVVAVAGSAALSRDRLAAVCVAVGGFFIANGFLENRYGDLSWHGGHDAWLAMGLISGVVLGLLVGEGWVRVHELRSRWRDELWWRAEPGDQQMPIDQEEEKRHG
jgi:hypothetical protein